MRDVISVTPSGLVDTLGSRQRVRALFTAELLDGALQLTSTRVEVRFLGRLFRVPRLISPRVHLEERFSESDDRQYVSVTLGVPLIGRIYEYARSFQYELTPASG